MPGHRRPAAKRHLVAFRWRADGDPLLDVYWDIKIILCKRGITMNFQLVREYHEIFVITKVPHVR